MDTREPPGSVRAGDVYLRNSVEYTDSRVHSLVSVFGQRGHIRAHITAQRSPPFYPRWGNKRHVCRTTRSVCLTGTRYGQSIDVEPLAVYLCRGCRIVWPDECCFGGRQTRSCVEQTLPILDTVEHETHEKYIRQV